MGGFSGNVVNASSGKRQIWQDPTPPAARSPLSRALDTRHSARSAVLFGGSEVEAHSLFDEDMENDAEALRCLLSGTGN